MITFTIDENVERHIIRVANDVDRSKVICINVNNQEFPLYEFEYNLIKEFEKPDWTLKYIKYVCGIAEPFFYNKLITNKKPLTLHADGYEIHLWLEKNDNNSKEL